MAPTGLYQTLASYIKEPEKVEPPMLSASAAAALSIAYTALYVLPFYLSSKTRPSPTLSRDAPSVIRARTRFVTISVFICSLFTIYILSIRAYATPSEIFRRLGWYPIQPLETCKSLFLTGLLFAGPLFERGIIDSGWRSWIQGHDLLETLSSWIGWRNYVAGPVTEEILFRSLLVPLHMLIVPHSSPATLVFATPLYFGIAHMHHFYEYTLTHPFTPTLSALLRSVVQFAYTTVFGWYATFVFLRTGSVWAVMVVHTFCNWMGLPRIWGRVGGLAIEGGVVGGPVRGKEDEERRDEGDAQLGIVWSVAYYVLLVAGVVVWWMELWPLTESGGALVRAWNRPVG